MFITHQTQVIYLVKQLHIKQYSCLRTLLQPEVVQPGLGRNFGIATEIVRLNISQGLLGSTEAEHKLFLFDIQMFTQLLISGNPSPAFSSVRTYRCKS